MLRAPWSKVLLLTTAITLAQSARAINACAPLPAATAPGFQSMLQAYLDDACYKDTLLPQPWQHDPKIRGAQGVHPNVMVWYSPEIWNWLTKQNRQGDAPEHGLLIKEQYGDPDHPDKLTDWAVIVRDNSGAWDGWYWADLVPSNSVNPEPPPSYPPGTPHCAPIDFPSAGFGQYCINCHASAANGQNTFATTKYVLGAQGPALTSFPPDDSIHLRLAHMRRLGGVTALANDPVCMVPEANDHVVASGKPMGGPHTFLTSDQCTGCHNATATLSPAREDIPSMLYRLKTASELTFPQRVNVSPNGEWRNSMMGLAGRDPIFFSQLNSEITLHGNITTQPGQAQAFVENTCLHCHGVMGQRQYFEDTGKLFTRDQMQDPNSTYGALARDGISCTVCHRISPEGLSTPATYTGNFKLQAADQMTGPFNQPLKLPMKNALGMQPNYGDQITDSGLCGSCHTIILPVFRANGEPVLANGPNGLEQKTFTEQATFFEWQNSKFADNGSAPESCQGCHMPTFFRRNGISSTPFSFKIANIENSQFPNFDHSAPSSEIAIQDRDGYRRHLLLGINVFALEMFKQFRTELGLYDEDPMMRPSLKVENSIDTAIDQSANFIAKTRTADVKILSVTKKVGALQVDVQVTNKAGHNFPSGVGFRRAFVNFEVLNNSGDVIWASGRVAPDNASLLGGLKGLIVDGKGNPLQTETFTPTQQKSQPHFWAENPITRQDQVQIYEELVRNPEGYLTTSFIALNEKVKDNRLQPQGWSAEGPEASETAPVGTCVDVLGPAGQKKQCDPDYENGSGSNVVRYLVPLTRATIGASSVRATLYYQTIPPYYQLQRSTDAKGLDTDRLVRMVNTLQVDSRPVDRWVLPIGTDQAEIVQ